MANENKLIAGDQAPDFSIEDLDGAAFSPADFRGKNSIVIVFLRYIGCPLCRRYIARLTESADDFKSAGAELVVFVQSSAADIRKHSKVKSYPFRIIPDPDARIYELFGVGRTAPLSMLNPQVALGVVRAMTEGHMHGALMGDELRAPGAFIIDKNGILRMAHAGAHVADIPPARDLLSTVKE